VAFTITQYVQTVPEAGRRDANALAELIISDSLAPAEAADKAGDRGTGKGCASNSRQQTAPKGPFLFAGPGAAGKSEAVSPAGQLTRRALPGDRESRSSQGSKDHCRGSGKFPWRG
jgi:hypothetical protein